MLPGKKRKATKADRAAKRLGKQRKGLLTSPVQRRTQRTDQLHKALMRKMLTG